MPFLEQLYNIRAMEVIGAYFKTTQVKVKAADENIVTVSKKRDLYWLMDTWSH